ncbi:hypothetical protein ORI20_13915 [Mycobacterium sp. CVI_P3]|uniref:Uncharacterized protein n=1 Tax=Mycobacterium pinniadriaticum TaxID=2994102 RepID=A0ABT3SE59_9MYCO|nr:hypothetical protein [Mycobacterium pinniadriaticum]MCX2931376.1 hypothetical protein [Mycobacterium pinniadriaticum]MCX2937800.1 hypothetical protein [Mycobacterium pinniadriaticum]
MSETPMLPAGRGERRTRIFSDDYGDLLYDSATSDEHPHDFMRSHGLRAVNAVIDFHNVIDRNTGRPARWSGKICQRSRRRFENIDACDYLTFLMWVTNPFIPAPRYDFTSSIFRSATRDWLAYREHFAEPTSPYTIVDMYGRDSTPDRWAPIVEPEPLQLGHSVNTLAERARRVMEQVTPYLLTEGLI